MPDLSLRGSHRYWYEYRDNMIYRVLCFMEGVENWTYDGDPTIEKAIQPFGEVLENIKPIDLNKLGHEESFIALANCLNYSRVLRLLQAIDTVHPGSASKLLVYAEEHSSISGDAPSLFLRRNIVFERLRLIGRVFSAERLKLVSAALEGEEDVKK